MSSNYETPYIIWNISKIKKNIADIMRLKEKYNLLLMFPVKASPNEKILNIFNQFGFGFDCSNFGEIKQIDKINPKAIKSLTGPNILSNIATIKRAKILDLDSLHQLEHIPDSVKFGLRFNFNKQVGYSPSRFGITDISDIPEYYREYKSRLTGIHLHLSEQYSVKKNIPLIIKKYASIINKLSYMNIGGSYDDFSLKEMERLFKNIRKYINVPIILEMGSFYFKNAISLRTKILDIKEISQDKFYCILNSSALIHCRWSTPQFVYSAEKYNLKRKSQTYFFMGNSCSENDFLTMVKTAEPMFINKEITFDGISCYALAFNQSFNGIPKIKEVFYEQS